MEWIKSEVGVVLPPEGEAVLVCDHSGRIEYRPIRRSVDECGDSRCENFAYFARVTPPGESDPGFTKQHLREALDLLAGLIDSWNDAAADGDRGRDNKALCLTLWDDGSGRLGTVWRHVDEMNTQCGFDNVEELAEYLGGWMRLGSGEADSAVKVDEPKGQSYYIIDATKGDLASFWKPKAQGRTLDLRQAGVFGEDEIKTAYYRHNPELLFVPVEAIGDKEKVASYNRGDGLFLAVWNHQAKAVAVTFGELAGK